MNTIAIVIIVHFLYFQMEADHRSFKDVHSKELSSMKRFHNTVHTKSTSIANVSSSLKPSASDSRLFLASEESLDHRLTEDRRGSFPMQSTGTKLGTQKRRHSVQADSSKYGRSFRKLWDAIAPSNKGKVMPESMIQKSQSSSLLTDTRPGVMLVQEAKEKR